MYFLACVASIWPVGDQQFGDGVTAYTHTMVGGSNFGGGAQGLGGVPNLVESPSLPLWLQGCVFFKQFLSEA